MKKITILAIGFGLVVFSQKAGFSYFGTGIGARALGMGGAFVAVGEGIDSCYWNPAGLGNINESEVTIMRTMNNRDITNYQEWLAAGTKLGDYGGLGVSYVRYKLGFLWREKDTKKLTFCVGDDEWVGLAIGGYGKEQFKNVALGVNIRKRSSSLLRGTVTTNLRWSNCEPTGHTVDFIEYDVGVLYYVNKEFSIGLIIQNFNESTVNYGEDSPIYEFAWRKNIKPGIAWRPDEKTIFAIDVYYFRLKDVYTTDIGEGQSEVRIGFERWCTDKIAIRAGLLSKYYHTIGFGLKGIELKKLFKDVKYDMDYALLESYGEGTHFLSCTARF
ncbi:MAG: hypothetical protein AB1567_13695 [bacterium]